MDWILFGALWSRGVDDAIRRTVFDHNAPGGDVETSGQVAQLDKNTIQIVGVSQGPPSRRKQMQFELLRSIDEALKDFAEQHLKG